jgi:predicted Rossmann-fold nucleotide-binding protein
VLGVVSTLFRERRPNRHMTQIIAVPDLHDRMRALVDLGDAYVALWGKSGTLAEAALVWALLRAGSLTPRPVLLLGARWERLFAHLRDAGVLEGVEARCTRVVRTPDEVPGVLRDATEPILGG